MHVASPPPDVREGNCLLSRVANIRFFCRIDYKDTPSTSSMIASDDIDVILPQIEGGRHARTAEVLPLRLCRQIEYQPCLLPEFAHERRRINNMHT